jgi:hypothetical protein
MSGTRTFLISFAIASCLAATGTASAYHTRFMEWSVLVKTR